MDDKVKNCILDFISNIKMPEYEEIFSTDIVMWAVKSAYGDAKRTMQGISCFSEEKDAALDEIGEGILEYFTVLEPATSQEEFDVLHEKLCNTWTKHFNDKLIGAYGKAQKIVNMTFKYLFCIDFGKKKYGIQEIASHKTVIIVVDELDRCLPMYSIKVLERLHHIFNELNNVIVIVSMDKRQLEHSIKAIYGEIDVDTYLRKFISFKVGLNTGKASRYAEKFQEYFLMFDMTAEEREDVENFLSDILKGLDMRTQERIFNKARVMHIIAKSDDVRDCSIMTFEILYLTVSLKMKSKNLCWLSKVWTSTFVNEREKLGHAYYEMLNEYGKRVCGPHFTNGIRIINDTVIGRTFFWLSILYKNIEKQPFILYPQATSAATKLVEQFAEIIDIIDVD